jgi:hypothetical protein
VTPQTSPLGQETRVPELPPLPSLVRYYDDFDDQFRTVRQLEQLSAWTITANGLSRSLNLEVGGPWHTRLLKVFVADLIARRANTTVLSYYAYLEPLRSSSLVRILESIALDHPTEFRDRWIVEFHPSLSPNQMRAVRYFASAAARMAIGQWTAGDQALVRALPGAPLDKYARVREGDCFLSVSAQSEIVQFIDEAASAASQGRADFETLRLASILALSYQYGARPGQIARIKASDVRCHPSGGVHVSIVLLKRRGQQRGRTVVRSVQREWCILFREFLKQQRDESGSKLFGYIPTQVSAAVSALTDELTGTAYSPGDLRRPIELHQIEGASKLDSASRTDWTARAKPLSGPKAVQAGCDVARC